MLIRQGETQRSSSDGKLANQERIAMLEERFFAQDKLMGQQLLKQHERLQQLETRMLGLESKLEKMMIGSVTESNMDITNVADSRRAQSAEEIRDDAGRLRVQSVEDQVKQLEKCFGDLKNSHTPEEFPKVIDRITAVELSQKSLEAKTSDMGSSIEAKINNLGTQIATPSSRSMDFESAYRWAQDLKQAPEYRLQPSVWDVLVFGFTPELGFSASIFSSFLVLVNVLGQFLMLLVFNVSFLNPDINDGHAEAAKQFRHDISHDYRFLDSLSQRSLAARICDANVHVLHLEVGLNQRQALDHIEDFLKENSSYSEFFNGQMMCMLALACWTSIILQEYVFIFDFAGAVALLPRKAGERTHISVQLGSNDDSCRLHLRNVSVQRTIAILLSLMVRAAIAANLLYAGNRWLATTANIRDLLLNAVALEFILSLDEILYGTFTSSHTRAILECFAPLKRPHSVHLAGFEMRKVFLAVCVPVAVAIFYNIFTVHMVDSMKKVRAELCDPPLDFVYGRDAFRFVHLAETAGRDDRTKTARLAVQEALDTKGSTDLAGLTYSFHPSHSSLSVKDAVSLPFIELVGFFNRGCQDVLAGNRDPDTEVIWLHFEALFGSSACPELKHGCFDYGSESGAMIRAFCPVTCGCNTLASDLPATARQWGCPAVCTETEEYLDYLDDASCMNPTFSHLNATTYWPKLVQFLLGRKDKASHRIASALSQYGCNFDKPLLELSSAYVSNLCEGVTFTGLKPLAAICPQTCKCAEEAHPYCINGPTSDYCVCLPVLEHLLNQTSPPRGSSRRCQSLICRFAWAEAEPYIASRYKELWDNMTDTTWSYCHDGLDHEYSEEQDDGD